MTKLADVWSQLTNFPNGEVVGKRMAQLLELSLRPGNEDLYPSVQRVWQAIEGREEQFLVRTSEEIRQTGSATSKLEQAMKKASDTEWDEFKRAIKLEPIKDAETERIITDGSGLVRTSGFEDWVLGKTEKPTDSEITIAKARISRKES